MSRFRKTAAATDATGKLAEGRARHDGLPTEYLRLGYLSVSDPTKKLHEQVVGSKIRCSGNPILRWHASNAMLRRCAIGNIKLDKEKSRRKIDAIAVLRKSVASAIAYSEDRGGAYQKNPECCGRSKYRRQEPRPQEPVWLLDFR